MRGVIRFAAFSPNGQLLASGSKDSTVKVWRRSPG
ncbi:WD40 repeat domain-containing protein [Neosynechococcus sphagnicola]|nr:WD40 repeat domain-containing protein [Neosynechococcus sphagnicola]